MSHRNGYRRLARLKTGLPITVWGLAIILSMPAGTHAVAADPPQAEAAEETPAAISEQNNQRMERHRNRVKKKRNSHRGRQKNRDAKPIQAELQLNGSFQLSLSGSAVIHGEGSLNIKLDREAVEELSERFAGPGNGNGLGFSDWLPILERLPETLKSTSEILQHLSDPDLQQQMKQVEQLLQFLPHTQNNGSDRD